MSWNYRIMKTWDETTEEWIFGIHECHYDEGMSEPHSWTSNPVSIVSDSHDGLRKMLASATEEAFSKKVLVNKFQPVN